MGSKALHAVELHLARITRHSEGAAQRLIDGSGSGSFLRVVDDPLWGNRRASKPPILAQPPAFVATLPSRQTLRASGNVAAAPRSVCQS